MGTVSILYRDRDPRNAGDCNRTSWSTYLGVKSSRANNLSAHRPTTGIHGACQAGTKFISNAMPLQNCKSSCNALTKPTSHEAITVAGLVNISQPVVSHTPNTESPENMVSLEAVRAHNSNLEDLGTGLVAVFGAFNPS